MAMPSGTFIWYDVMTSDTKGAEAFYRSVMGWNASDFGNPERPYTIFSVGENGMGGLMPIPDEARAQGVPPCWTGYVGVDDVDAFAKRVTAAGGTVRRPPEDIPDVGRFSVVADPYGAVFILFKGFSPEGPLPAAQGTPGYVDWHELHAGDGAKAFDFYSGLFGWTKAEAMDMGAMGVYQIFNINGVPAGGMMTKAAEMPMSSWLYYFNVEAIDAAMARVTQSGGKIINGPMEVPGPMWIAQCLDPQGAMFAMVGAKR